MAAYVYATLKASQRSVNPALFLWLVLALNVTGCDFIGDVLEFSFWAVLIVILFVALLIYGLIRVLF